MTARGSRGTPRGPELVGALLADARAASARAGGPGGIDAELWRRVVGPRIGDRTAPGRLERGTLLVRVASAVWAQELSLLSDDIIGRLRAAGLVVDALRFRVERLEARPRVAAAAAPAPPPQPLPEELEKRLARVDDPELRGAIAEAASYSLALDTRRAAGASEPKRDVPDPRSAASESDRPDRTSPAPHAGTRRRRGGHRG